VLDHVGGRADIAARVIRAVGEPERPPRRRRAVRRPAHSPTLIIATIPRWSDG